MANPACKHTPQPTGYVEWHMWAEKKQHTNCTREAAS